MTERVVHHSGWEVIASEETRLEHLREAGIKVQTPPATASRIELVIVKAATCGDTMGYDYDVHARGPMAERASILAQLGGEEGDRNCNRVGSRCSQMSNRAFGGAPHPARLVDVTPESFAFALVELRRRQLIRLASDLYPFIKMPALSDDDARKTELLEQAMVLGGYARSGAIPHGQSEDDILILFHALARPFFANPQRLSPIQRRDVLAPLDPATAMVHSDDPASLSLDLVLMGALLRLQLSTWEYRNITGPLFEPTEGVTPASLALLAGRSLHDVLENEEAWRMEATDETEHEGGLVPTWSTPIAPDVARRWLRLNNVAGFV